MSTNLGSQTNAFVVGTIVITSASGGTQLPNQPVNGVTIPSEYLVSGSSTPINSNGQIIVGGVGSDAPYFDSTIFPSVKGIQLGDFGNGVGINPLVIPVSNLNQISMVAVSGASGIAAIYWATAP